MPFRTSRRSAEKCCRRSGHLPLDEKQRHEHDGEHRTEAFKKRVMAGHFHLCSGLVSTRRASFSAAGSDVCKAIHRRNMKSHVNIDKKRDDSGITFCAAPLIANTHKIT